MAWFLRFRLYREPFFSNVLEKPVERLPELAVGPELSEPMHVDDHKGVRSTPSQDFAHLVA